MKNIHLIPIDKPSRLFNCFGKLGIGDYTTTRENLQVTNQHIYITSDEEIKEGDFGYNFISGTVDRITDPLLANKAYYKKIILTTDQDLIKDGVQAIDDEFLEWFVKNPSCEEVEVQRDFADEGIKGITYYGKYFLIIPKEELKQETLEEAGQNYAEKACNGQFPIEYTRQQVVNHTKNDFIAGAKYQAERMYSEEDIMNALHSVEVKNNKDYSKIYNGMKEWFEQLKKKYI